MDRDTLIERWYVHRIRLHSEGTARQVRIGTEAFARPVEWFTLNDCHITERGLSTPAVERIVRAHSAPPPSRWAPGKTRKVPKPDAHAESLLRRLLYGRRIESSLLVKQVCREIEGLRLVSPAVQEELETAVRHAHIWLDEQNGVCRKLFARLDRAVTDRRAGKVRRLLVRVNATAAHNRTQSEKSTVAAASDYLNSLDDLTHAALDAEAAAEREGVEAARGVRTILQRLRRHDAYTHDLLEDIGTLLRLAAVAGERLTSSQSRGLDVWKARADAGAWLPRTPLHEQVGRRQWWSKPCPRCHAEVQERCVLVEGSRVGSLRDVPHDERLQPIIAERKAQRAASAGRWRVDEVTCPDCRKGYHTPCDSPNGPHRSRVELAQEYTRLRRPRTRK
ncbi:hypothetical protein [Streptomyces sp. NBC_01176]|uniref:zinc finger domain-containing protein n=1 Tax=Streptomyces sp. NBC_01176 TaxID=2903760 RepID=UPI003870A1E1|nr:hypothetical protein OG199_44225 [Streptomyces sp. NBC_01176]